MNNKKTNNQDMLMLELRELEAKYPEFISSSFTLDLDNISLRDDKFSTDVLNLF